MSESFDVFLSHNSLDKEIVRRLFRALESRNLKVWLDEEELIPGRDWQEGLEDIIKKTRSAAVLFGSNGAGPWEIPEMRACLNQFVTRQVPVIPVLLPGAPVKPDLPLFLQRFTWVDMRDGLEPSAIDNLVWGITGVHPEDGVDQSDYQKTIDKASAGVSNSKTIVPGFLPYLADRDAQENMIQVELSSHFDKHRDRPIVFIVHGRESECCDMFIKRLTEHSLPMFLSRLMGSNQIDVKSVRWPESQSSSSDDPLPRKLRDYLLALGSKLELSPGFTPDQLVKQIGLYRRATIFTSIAACESWQKNEYQLIEAVLKFWAALPDVPATSQPVIILLSISYPPAEISIIQRFINRQPKTSIQESISNIKSPDSGLLRLFILPELSSLSLYDIEEWVREVMRPNEVDDVLRIVRALFRKKRKEAEQSILDVLKTPNADHIMQLLRTLFEHQEKKLSKEQRIPMEPLAPILKELLLNVSERAREIRRSF